jgi:hypothetical protein
MPPPKSTQAFDQLKKLEGKWTGKTMMNGKEETITASYKLTSGDTVILETLGEGTKHEMVSMYYPEGKTAAMKHYCMLGNQPTMKFKSSDDKSISFEMKGIDGIKSAKEMHMHALNIKWEGSDKITQEWISYHDGKKQPPTVFTLTRQ